jgi:hypothetical protein
MLLDLIIELAKLSDPVTVLSGFLECEVTLLLR